MTWLTGPALTTWIDAEYSIDSVSRVMCTNDPVCLTTNTAQMADTLGLVTQFLPAEIFEDGFESGDTSAWSTSVP